MIPTIDQTLDDTYDYTFAIACHHMGIKDKKACRSSNPNQIPLQVPSLIEAYQRGYTGKAL